MEKRTGIRMSDDAFSFSFTKSVFYTIICIISLSVASFIWFFSSQLSKDSFPSCDITATVFKCENEDEILQLRESEKAKLNSKGNYTVILELPKESVSGYLVILVNDEKYYTDSILKHSEEDVKTLSFALDVRSARTLTFLCKRGICTEEARISDGAILVID